jgi:hypothetical protein
MAILLSLLPIADCRFVLTLGSEPIGNWQLEIGNDLLSAGRETFNREP